MKALFYLIIFSISAFSSDVFSGLDEEKSLNEVVHFTTYFVNTETFDFNPPPCQPSDEAVSDSMSCINRQATLKKLLDDSRKSIKETIEVLSSGEEELIILGEDHYHRSRTVFYRELLEELQKDHQNICLFLETGRNMQPYVDRIFKQGESAASVLAEVNAGMHTPMAPDKYEAFEGYNVNVFAIDLSEYPAVSESTDEANRIWNERNRAMAQNLLELNESQECEKSVLINGRNHISGNSSETQSMTELLEGEIEHIVVNVLRPERYTQGWHDTSCEWNPPYLTTEFFEEGNGSDEYFWKDDNQLEAMAVDHSALNESECEFVRFSHPHHIPQIEQTACHFDMTIIFP